MAEDFQASELAALNISSIGATLPGTTEIPVQLDLKSGEKYIKDVGWAINALSQAGQETRQRSDLDEKLKRFNKFAQEQPDTIRKLAGMHMNYLLNAVAKRPESLPYVLMALYGGHPGWERSERRIANIREREAVRHSVWLYTLHEAANSNMYDPSGELWKARTVYYKALPAVLRIWAEAGPTHLFTYSAAQLGIQSIKELRTKIMYMDLQTKLSERSECLIAAAGMWEQSYGTDAPKAAPQDFRNISDNVERAKLKIRDAIQLDQAIIEGSSRQRITDVFHIKAFMQADQANLLFVDRMCSIRIFEGKTRQALPKFQDWRHHFSRTMLNERTPADIELGKKHNFGRGLGPHLLPPLPIFHQDDMRLHEGKNRYFAIPENHFNDQMHLWADHRSDEDQLTKTLRDSLHKASRTLANVVWQLTSFKILTSSEAADSLRGLRDKLSSHIKLLVTTPRDVPINQAPADTYHILCGQVREVNATLLKAMNELRNAKTAYQNQPGHNKEYLPTIQEWLKELDSAHDEIENWETTRLRMAPVRDWKSSYKMPPSNTNANRSGAPSGQRK